MQTLKKKAQVILLDSINKSNIIESRHGRLSNLQSFDDDFTYKHLYFIIDEQPTSNEWYYDVRDNVLSNNCLGITYFSKKVIATTDKSLIKKGKCNCFATTYEGCSECLEDLPQPSDSFIHEYISEYNKGNIIKEVMVHYEIIFEQVWVDYNDTGEWIREPKEVLKVDRNNCITITPCKESWNREEVINLLNKFEKDLYGGITVTDGQNKPVKPKWIENNL